jgi:hypothetical protein
VPVVQKRHAGIREVLSFLVSSRRPRLNDS